MSRGRRRRYERSQEPGRREAEDVSHVVSL